MFGSITGTTLRGNSDLTSTLCCLVCSMVETWEGDKPDAWEDSHIGLAESCINLPSAVFNSNSTSSPFMDLYETFQLIALLIVAPS